MVPPEDFDQVQALALIREVMGRPAQKSFSSAHMGSHKVGDQMVTGALNCQKEELPAQGKTGTWRMLYWAFHRHNHYLNLTHAETKENGSSLFQTTCKFRMPHVIFFIGAGSTTHQKPSSF